MWCGIRVLFPKRISIEKREMIFSFINCVSGMVHSLWSESLNLTLFICLCLDLIIVHWIRSRINSLDSSIHHIFAFIIILYLLIKFLCLFPSNINISFLPDLVVLMLFRKILISRLAFVYYFSNLRLFIFLSSLKFYLCVMILPFNPLDEFILNLSHTTILLLFPL